MTFDEAKEVFLHPGKWAEAIVVISAYLEKNPNEDCISRQAVKDLISKYIILMLLKPSQRQRIVGV